MILFLLSQLALAGPCEVSTTSDQLRTTTDDAMLAFATLDDVGFEHAAQTADTQLSCLDEVIPPRIAAAYHRVSALRALMGGDGAAVEASLRAALLVEPDYVLSPRIAPEGGKLFRAYASAKSAGRPKNLPLDLGATAWVNGVEARSAPTVPAVLQVADPDGGIAWSGAIAGTVPSEALPTTDAIADVDEASVSAAPSDPGPTPTSPTPSLAGDDFGSAPASDEDFGSDLDAPSDVGGADDFGSDLDAPSDLGGADDFGSDLDPPSDLNAGSDFGSDLDALGDPDDGVGSDLDVPGDLHDEFSADAPSDLDAPDDFGARSQTDDLGLDLGPAPAPREDDLSNLSIVDIDDPGDRGKGRKAGKKNPVGWWIGAAATGVAAGGLVGASHLYFKPQFIESPSQQGFQMTNNTFYAGAGLGAVSLGLTSVAIAGSF